MSVYVSALGMRNYSRSNDEFANHCDWRIPSSRELETIYDGRYCGANKACIDPEFGPTKASFYVSITTDAVSPDSSFHASGVDFSGRGTYARPKIYSFYVRAVRTLVRGLVSVSNPLQAF